jgi:hypothetical protein
MRSVGYLVKDLSTNTVVRLIIGIAAGLAALDVVVVSLDVSAGVVTGVNVATGILAVVASIIPTSVVVARRQDGGTGGENQPTDRAGSDLRGERGEGERGHIEGGRGLDKQQMK